MENYNKKRIYVSIFLLVVVLTISYMLFIKKRYDYLILILFPLIDIYRLLKKRETLTEEFFKLLIIDNYNEIRKYQKLYGSFLIFLIFLSILYVFNIHILVLIILFTAYFVYFYLSLIFKKMEQEDTYELADYLQNMVVFVLTVLFLFAFIYQIPTEKDYLMYRGKKYTPDFWSAVYFSGVTLFSLGYGDITPLGTSFRMISIFEVSLGVFFIITFFAFGLSLIYDKIQKKRWKPIEKEALNLIDSKLWNLSIDILTLFKETRPVIPLPLNATNEEIWKIFDEKQIEIIKELAHGEEAKLIDKINHEYIEVIEKSLERGYTGLFSKYQENIDILEQKYGNYLDTNLRLILIKIQNELNVLSLAFKTKEWYGKVGFEKMVVLHSQRILLEIEKLIDLKIIER